MRGQRILAETLQGAQIPDHGHYPGLDKNHWAETGEEPVAVRVPADSFRRMTEKIVRGLFYVQEKKLIELPNTIEFLALGGESAAFWERVVEKFGSVYVRGPGLVIRRAVAPEDGISSLFAITFWDQFKTYASVTRDEDEAEEPIVAAKGPSITDIKMLFARSGNRCAFPKCTAPMAYNETLTGEVCHIKGARRGSARHDADQLAGERHQYSNLILMCPTHHTVIDDDEEAYTVERLLRMKSEHEARSEPVPDTEAARVAMTFVQSVSNTGQSGGLSAPP
jgi:hypothetical protein